MHVSYTVSRSALACATSTDTYCLRVSSETVTGRRHPLSYWFTSAVNPPPPSANSYILTTEYNLNAKRAAGNNAANEASIAANIVNMRFFLDSDSIKAFKREQSVCLYHPKQCSLTT